MINQLNVADGPRGGEMGGEGGEMSATMMGGEMGGEGGEMGEGNVFLPSETMIFTDPIETANGGMGHGGNGNNHGPHNGGGEGHDTDSSEEGSDFKEYLEEHSWLFYIIVIVFVGLFCFLCCLSTCMCKEAFCRGSCKYCRCSRNRRRCQQNNMQRRNAEYTELQQV